MRLGKIQWNCVGGYGKMILLRRIHADCIGILPHTRHIIPVSHRLPGKCCFAALPGLRLWYQC